MTKNSTAFSPTYQERVTIYNVRYDSNGVAILDATLQSDPKRTILFREYELTDFQPSC